MNCMFRRESFGGIIFCENPAFTAFVDETFADSIQIPRRSSLPDHCLSAPLDVHMSITTRCNSHCAGCYAIDPVKPAEDMAFSVAVDIVDNLASLGVFTIALGGGEPLLYPRLLELAHHIRSRRLVPTLTTNGKLVDSYPVNEFRVFGSVHLSLHSMDERDHLESAVKHLRSVSITPTLNFLVTSSSIADLESAFAWAAEVDIDKILLLKFKLTNENQQFGCMQLSAKDERAIFPQARKASRRLGILPLVDCSLFPAVAIHGSPVKDMLYYDLNGCKGGDRYMAVDVKGRYQPCSFWPSTFGDARTLSPGEWAESTALNDFRTSSLDPQCEECDYLSICNRGCRLVYRQVCQIGMNQTCA